VDVDAFERRVGGGDRCWMYNVSFRGRVEETCRRSVCLSVCLSVGGLGLVWFGLVCGLVGWSSLRSADRLIGRRGKRGLLTAPRPGDASRTHLRALP
jgi:hypothetical protein